MSIERWFAYSGTHGIFCCTQRRRNRDLRGGLAAKLELYVIQHGLGSVNRRSTPYSDNEIAACFLVLLDALSDARNRTVFANLIEGGAPSIVALEDLFYFANDVSLVHYQRVIYG